MAPQVDTKPTTAIGLSKADRSRRRRTRVWTTDCDPVRPLVPSLFMNSKQGRFKVQYCVAATKTSDTAPGRTPPQHRRHDAHRDGHGTTTFQLNRIPCLALQAIGRAQQIDMHRRGATTGTVGAHTGLLGPSVRNRERYTNENSQPVHKLTNERVPER